MSWVGIDLHGSNQVANAVPNNLQWLQGGLLVRTLGTAEILNIECVPVYKRIGYLVPDVEINGYQHIAVGYRFDILGPVCKTVALQLMQIFPHRLNLTTQLVNRNLWQQPGQIFLRQHQRQRYRRIQRRQIAFVGRIERPAKGAPITITDKLEMTRHFSRSHWIERCSTEKPCSSNSACKVIVAR